MYKSIILFISLFTANFLKAQAFSGSTMRMGTEMSLPTLMGTARFVGTGGVLGSVGGDISNLNTNPAGLAMFSRTELEFTPTMSINNVNSNYILGDGTGGSYSTNFDINRFKFTLNSAGIVIANRRSDKNALRSSNVTIGINRIADFNKTTNFGMSSNRVYSYSNYLANQATNIYNNYSGGFPDPPIPQDYISLHNVYNQALMSKNTGLIYFDTTGFYADPTDINNVHVSQFGQQKVTGGLTELSFAWSGNIVDKYYFGFSLGLPFLSYQSDFIIYEDNRGTSSYPNSFYGKYKGLDLIESDKYTGVGANLKFGVLAKLDSHIRVSGFIHTPTFMEVTNDYLITMTTRFENSNTSRNQPVDDFQFSYYTPFKCGAGLSYVFGKRGFIAAEYEYNGLRGLEVDVKDEPLFTSGFNARLKSQLQNIHTFKVGADIVIPTIDLGYNKGNSKTSPFRLRLGYNYRTSPYQSDMIFENGDRVTHTFSAGLGYRSSTTSIDLAFMKSQFRDYKDIYVFDENTFGGVSSWNNINQVSATVNFRFGSVR